MIASEDQQLWKAYEATKSPEVREKIVKRYLPLVRYVVGRMVVTPPPGLDYEDILSFGVIGLLHALEKFDLSRGFVFQTYAVPRIRGAILDELRKYDWISRTGREKLQKLEHAMEDLLQKHGQVEDSKLQEELGMDEGAYRELLEISERSFVVSLDETLGYGDGEMDRGDSLADPSALPDEVLEQREEYEWLYASLQELSEREQLVLSLYYAEGLTLKEIGAILGVTESRVSQIHGKALMVLRTKKAL
jgi:RNA polymerase sigma factor for flagellar operon FliA